MSSNHGESSLKRQRVDNEEEEEKKGPVALITGITGQDGSYLAELLLEKVRE